MRNEQLEILVDIVEQTLLSDYAEKDTEPNNEEYDALSAAWEQLGVQVPDEFERKFGWT